MKKILLPALIAAVHLAGLAAPAAGSAQMVTAHDPQRVRALLDRWGYHPGEITTNGETPSFLITIDGLSTGVGFGNCTNGRGCTYLVLVNTYTDVANPPLEWLNALNRDYDNVTVVRDAENLMTLRASIILGAGGIPESLFREVLSEWVAANNEIADRAVAANLAAPAPAAAPQT